MHRYIYAIFLFMCYMQHKNSSAYVLKSILTLLTITCWALDDHLGDCTIYFFQQVTSLSRQGPNKPLG